MQFIQCFNAFYSKVHTHALYDDYKYDIALLGKPHKNIFNNSLANKLM